MTENFLMENPLQLFDDFKTIPEEAYKFSSNEIKAVVDAVIESEDYLKILNKIYINNPEEIFSRLNDFKQELEKANSNFYSKEKSELIKYFMGKTIGTLEEIIQFNGTFKKIPIKIIKLDENVKLPYYSDPGDACMDICSNVNITINPNETVVIPTGIKVIIPGGYELQIRPRSGLSKNTGLRITNTPGTIDSGFRHEIGIIMQNTSNQPFEIKKYDRIAQLKVSEVPHIVWDEITEEEYQKFQTNRGEGFGSSGLEAKNV